MKRLITFSLSLVLLAQSPRSKSKPEPYDPDKLAPMEIACGREGAKNAASCKCMEARRKRSLEEQVKCKDITVPFDHAACMVYAQDICVQHVIDREHSWIEHMPVECSRYCSKARCECCHS